jgi:hypothetical protein
MIRSTTAVPTRRRPWLGRSLAAVATAGLLVTGAACASESDNPAAPDVETGESDAPEAPSTGEFEATVAYLQGVAEKSAAEGYHTDIYLSMTGDVAGATAPMMTGDIEGAEFHYVMDLGPLMNDMMVAMGQDPSTAGVFDGIDMSMEMAGDDQVLYLRAPMFSDPMFTAGAAGPTGGLDRLGGGWGVVDLTALGDQLPTEVAAGLTSQGIDPRAVIEMIEGVDGVEDLGTGDVDGTPVHGLSADTTMADLIEASGQDPDALAAASGGGAGDAVEVLYETPTSIEVWIDDGGYLRRMEFGWSFDDVFAAMGEDPAMLDSIGMGGLAFAYRMDMSEYGTTVDFEAPADPVDITDEYAELLNAPGL